MKFISILLTMTFILAGCVDTPVQSTSVVDDRPRITFDAKLMKETTEYSVSVDGIDYGALANYLANENALRIISGKHKVTIFHGSSIIKTYDIVLGANETRVLKVPEHE